MENENKTEQFQDDNWFAGLLSTPEMPDEIGADENAVSAAGLTHPADLELERIIMEAKAMDQIEEPVSQEAFPLAKDAPPASPAAEESAFENIAEKREPLPEIPELEEDLPPAKRRMAVRKIRPRKKATYNFFGVPHILSTVIWLAIAVAIGVSLGRAIWVCAVDVLAFGKPSQECVVTIEEGDDISAIAKKLKEAGLISYPGIFEIYGRLTGAQEDIAPGSYTLNTKYDYNALVNFMTPHGENRETVEILIPEGYTCAQIFSILEAKNVCSVKDLEEYSMGGKLGDYWFLEGANRDSKHCLEGYLFPDTYAFYTNDDPGRVLRKFLDNFDYRFTQVMKDKIDPLNERLSKVLASRGFSKAYIEEHKITIREVVIIASMIEKETANDEESYTVASVIYNRLTNPGSYPMLNIDATLIYALGGNIDPETGKTKPLTKEDLTLDSPYNTYTEQGLPPGPISNPGRNSLDAALDFTQTNYYYYVYSPQAGKHLFAATKAEHDRNVASVNSQS
ncbi:MAG: endolytic transglycosylase MltG [Oscillospiraceae bacterium]|nr:endolytic transglycosylase MltG [Oscillospiraceae bacterium]